MVCKPDPDPLSGAARAHLPGRPESASIWPVPGEQIHTQLFPVALTCEREESFIASKLFPGIDSKSFFFIKYKEFNSD